MNPVYTFFIPKNQSFFDYLRAKILVILSLIGFVLTTILFLKEIVTWSPNSMTSVIPLISIFFLLSLQLGVLKIKGIKIAGNVMSIGMVLSFLIAMNILKENIPVLLKFTQEFYSVLALLTVSFLFATRIVLVINAFLILLSTTRVLLFAQVQLPEQKDMLTAAYIDHTVALVVITILGYFTIKFTMQAISQTQTAAKELSAKNLKLNTLIINVKDTINNHKKMSETVKKSAEKLRESSSVQASNVEEISATIEQMTASVSQNSDNTEKASQMVTNTLNFANLSEKSIQDTLSAVRDIHTKIMMIDDFAWQTGLLSLNASIEATKAGTAGRGFAVVAREIKKLAEKSGIGASEITSFVNSSLKISDRSAGYIKSLVSDIQNIDKALTDILKTSTEQRSGNEAINSSVLQINSISQENAHIAGKLAISIAELSEQSFKIQNLLNENK